MSDLSVEHPRLRRPSIRALVSDKRCIRCHEPFVVMEGRAKQGQYRLVGDFKFCSVRCSNAYHQQQYRDRRKAAR